MLQVANTSVALSAEKAADSAVGVAMVNGKMFSRSGIVGAADSASTPLRREHLCVFSWTQSVAPFSLVLGKSGWVASVTAFLRLIQMRAVVVGPFSMSSISALFADAVETIVISRVFRELDFAKNFLAGHAPLHAIRHRKLWWAHHSDLLCRAETRFAFTVRFAARGIKLIQWLGFAAGSARSNVHCHLRSAAKMLPIMA